MGVTLKDIAAAAEVSQAAVSYALQNKGHLSQSTRAHILSTAHKLGYRLNSSARATRTGRFNCVGYLTATDTQYGYNSPLFLKSLSHHLYQAGLQLKVHSCDSSVLQSADAIPALVSEQGIDGLIIDMCMGIPGHLDDFINKHQIPCLWVNHYSGQHAIIPDEQQAVQDGVKKLASIGHRHIAYLNYHAHRNDCSHFSIQARLNGYLSGMEVAQLMPHVWQQNIPRQQRPSFIKKLLSKKNPPSAIICWGNAGAVYMEAQLLGFTVPDDLSLIGFADETQVLDHYYVSNFCIPWQAMGRAAAQRLAALIEEEQAPKHELIAYPELDPITVAGPGKG